MQEKSHKFLTPAERILLFIDYQGITKYKFHKKIGVSNGFLDKSKEIRTDNLRKILENYPTINPLWLIKGEGKMLQSDSQKTFSNTEKQDLEKENAKLLDKNLELYEENSKLKDEIIKLLKKKLNPL